MLVWHLEHNAILQLFQLLWAVEKTPLQICSGGDYQACMLPNVQGNGK